MLLHTPRTLLRQEVSSLRPRLAYSDDAEPHVGGDGKATRNRDGYGLAAITSHFVALLKAHCRKRDVQAGAQVHAVILERGLLDADPCLASALVNMYARCGQPTKALQILQQTPVGDAHAWNAVITAYVQQGQCEEALSCLELMQQEGLSPDAFTFASILKVCGSTEAADKGKKVHDEIVGRGLLGKNAVIGNALVAMYAKCGDLEKAKQVLDELPDRNVISWSALVAGFAKQGLGEEALNSFGQMQCEAICPNEVTFISLLKACGIAGALDTGKQMHAIIFSQGWMGKDVVLGTALVDMYAKCGAFAKAQEVLMELPARNVVSWSALISAYTKHGLGAKALKCFDGMQREGHLPNTITLVNVLIACGNMGSADRGKQIHDEVARQGLLSKDTILGNAFIDMYVKCGALAQAQEVLDELFVRDIFSWNVLIGGYVQYGHGKEALMCFEQVRSEDLSPNIDTFIWVLKACSSISVFDIGKQIHDEVVSQNLLGKNPHLDTALVGMYANCSALSNAQEVFDILPVRDVIHWSALIGGYTQLGQAEEALNCFDHMQCEGVLPNAVTFIYTLKACGIIGAVDKGIEIHDKIMNQDLLCQVIVLGNALVDMYAKCGELSIAQEVLDKLPVRDVVSWSALIAGYAQQGQGEEALSCYERMQGEHLSPNEVTFACLLGACGSIGATDKGMQIHDEIISRGILEKGIVVGNALVDMYAKCGALAEARFLVDNLTLKNVVSWSSVIAGYAQHGQAKAALNCLECMRQEGFSPNSITFTCMLNACSRSGLVDEGEMCFATMTEKYGIVPGLNHLTCMVDLFGRVGNLDKAIALIKKMPSSDLPALWTAVLGGCLKWGNVKLGRWAFDHAVQVDDTGSEAYVLMANIYAAADMQDDAEEIAAMRWKILHETNQK